MRDISFYHHQLPFIITNKWLIPTELSVRDLTDLVTITVRPMAVRVALASTHGQLQEYLSLQSYWQSSYMQFTLPCK